MIILNTPYVIIILYNSTNIQINQISIYTNNTFYILIDILILDSTLDLYMESKFGAETFIQMARSKK